MRGLSTAGGLSGTSSGGRTPATQNFTSVDGSTGVTVTHNLGYRPPVVVVGSLDGDPSSEDNSSFGHVSHDSVNAFTVSWIGGNASGSITY